MSEAARIDADHYSLMRTFLLLPLLLAACSNHTATTTVSKTAETPLELQTNSPDATIKTWWKSRDQVMGHEYAECEKVRKDASATSDYKNFKALTTGLAAASIDQKECTPITLHRDIDEVKVESETRAVVIATIKPSTPIPPGATLTEIDHKFRDNGVRYKYVLGKVGKDWKIEQIHIVDSPLTGNREEAVFEEHRAPSVHSYIFGAQ